jgi:hypothetical protein
MDESNGGQKVRWQETGRDNTGEQSGGVAIITNKK